MNDIVCNVKSCINYEKGLCDITLPNIVSKLRPNNKEECWYYSNDLELEVEWLKKNGGMLNVILGKLNKSEDVEDGKRKSRR